MGIKNECGVDLEEVAFLSFVVGLAAVNEDCEARVVCTSQDVQFFGAIENHWSDSEGQQSLKEHMQRVVSESIHDRLVFEAWPKIEDIDGELSLGRDRWYFEDVQSPCLEGVLEA